MTSATSRSGAGSKSNQNPRSIYLPDSLLRSTLLRVGDEEHVLILMTSPQRFRRLVDGYIDARDMDALRSIFEWEIVALRTPAGTILGLRGVAA